MQKRAEKMATQRNEESGRKGTHSRNKVEIDVKDMFAPKYAGGSKKQDEDCAAFLRGSKLPNTHW
jgi:hypothetical protein